MQPEICKNCHTPLHGKYCSHCGQKNYTEKDKNLKGIFEEVLHFLTHFEGTLFTTVKTILLQPGKLSLDYCNGIRKKYYKPISFFLFLVVIYLLFPLMGGLNMKLEFYKTLHFSGGFISEQIQHKMQLRHLSEAELAEIFHHKSEKTSKILLFLLIPLTAVALQLMHWRDKRTAFEHFIVATEINNFMILVYFLLLPLLIEIVFRILGLSNVDDGSLLLFYGITFFAYITMIFRHFFGNSWFRSCRKALLFVLLYGVITQIIYKTLLFEITFALI